jgi:hypothetical protein
MASSVVATATLGDPVTKDLMFLPAAAAAAGVLAAVLGIAGCAHEAAAPAAMPARVAAVHGPPAPVPPPRNSDAFIWELFTRFAAPAAPQQPSPAMFETWASDADTFSVRPRWPGLDEPRQLRASALRGLTPLQRGIIDGPCAPHGSTPAPCIAEETRRNRPQFDYIVNHGLHTQAGLAAALARAFRVAMPAAAATVKGDWVAVQTLLEWAPQLGSAGNVRKLYHTTTSASVEYALVALHVNSPQHPYWVWGTFEHHLNPGRCDGIGCFDSFGAENPAVLPDRRAAHAQYGPCPKTPALKAWMAEARLAPVWDNYCLKSTQVDHNAGNGMPYALGQSVIERIVGQGNTSASSCVGCHAHASSRSLGSNDRTTATALALLPYAPNGKPTPAVLEAALQVDAMWGCCWRARYHCRMHVRQQYRVHQLAGLEVAVHRTSQERPSREAVDHREFPAACALP